MPKIQWQSLPSQVTRHLFQRASEREVTVEDLWRLDAWKRSNPDVPDGEWVKDFGTFKLVGEGVYPKTFLRPEQAARGQVLD